MTARLGRLESKMLLWEARFVLFVLHCLPRRARPWVCARLGWGRWAEWVRERLDEDENAVEMQENTQT